MTVVHVIEPFATGINTFVHELVMGHPEANHIIIYGNRSGLQNIDDLIAGYKGKATFIPWKHVQREVSIMKDVKALVSLISIIKKLKVDVLHLHSSKAGILGRVAAWVLGVGPVIYTPNAIAFLRTDIGFFKKGVFKYLERIFALFPGTIISSSRSEFQALYQLGITSKLINNGVDVDTGEIKKQIESFQVIMVGHITVQKSPKLFNQIAQGFIENKNINFIWVGDGELRNELTSPNIHVTGWLNKDEVYQKISESAIYLSSSLWEGLSLAGIEAMAFGLPMLVNECVGNINLVDHGNNGFIFKNAQEAITYINELILNPERYHQFSAASIDRYQAKYTGKRVATNYKLLYNQLIQEQAKTSTEVMNEKVLKS